MKPVSPSISMTYSLEFLPSARKEWDKLGASIRQQLVKKLRERLNRPRIPSAALHGMPDHYKIRLRQAGYRLVYRVDDARVVVLVIVVGKREGGLVYEIARKR
jgi:mRNA interferase RelE/StbE